MIRKLLKSLAAFLVLIMLSSSVMASGKMEVPLGENVTLQAEQTAVDYKWITKKGRDIVNTQTGSLFSYSFDIQGEYEVNLTVTDKAGAMKTSTVKVMVGDRYSKPVQTGSTAEGSSIDSPLRVNVETLPVRTVEKSIHIIGDEGRVVFDIATRPDILEYRIDRNVFIDSDGNGIANDDIDNASDSSYLIGGVWQTTYEASESNKIAAEITVVNTAGLKAKTQVEIIFTSAPAKDGKVVAILDTLPALEQTDKKIYVYGEKDTVAFYSRRSLGDIVEYRIDKNIFVDSDGDSNPANDIDNRNDKSFKSGDVWTTEYSKSQQQVIAQLIVVGSGGTGSRIQREVIFTEAPEVLYEETSSDDVIQLKADKDFVQKGDPVIFSVEGLTQDLDNYIFEWDFNGDEEVDQTVEGDNSVSYIYDSAAIHPVKVKVMDLDGNEANFNLDLLVKDIASTKADFEYDVSGLSVDFTNLSEVSLNLSSRILEYTWSFGDTDSDNYEAQRDKIGAQNPSYTYVKPGTYNVALTVVDADLVTDTKTVEIVLETPEGFVEKDIEGEVSEGTKAEKEGSIIGSIFKVILYIILIVILLVVLIVSGLLVFLKIQHPDLVFEELIDELKLKLLSMMGVHDMIEGTPAVDTKVDEGMPMPAAAPKEEVPAPEATVAPAQEPDLSKSDAPVPDWLKPKEPAAPAPDVIEGEVVEAPAPPTPKPADKPADKPAAGEDNLNKTDGPVPDWLKPS